MARRRTESVAAAAQEHGSHLTSRDIARAAGVSQATVSDVLNRPELVAAETELRVRKVMDAMGFVVNDSARKLRAGRSRAIGVVTLDLSLARAAEAFTAAAARTGLNVIVSPAA